MKKLKLTLAEGKDVEIYFPQIVYWGQVKIKVGFPAFSIEREYSIDLETLKAWKEANPSKKWKDFLIEKLLPLYEKIEKADAVKKKIEAVLE